MFANILIITLSVFVLAFIKKVFYKQAAIHPWIFSIFVYFPIMILFYLLIALALAEEGGSVPSAYFASIFVAYFVFAGGRNTRRMAEQYHDAKNANRIAKDVDKLQIKLQQLSSNPKYQPVDFSEFQLTQRQVVNAIFSLIYINESGMSNNSCTSSLNYLHHTLSFVSSSDFNANNHPMILSYLNSTVSKYFFGDPRKTRRSLKYVLLFSENKVLIIGPHNIAILDEPFSNQNP